MANQQTSWGGVADWYDGLIEGEGTYQKDVILPNIVRLLNPKKGETILDVGCGQGFFAREFAKMGANVIGVDVAPELIALAKKNVPSAQLHVASADVMPFVKTGSVSVATIILALQNIENVDRVFAECARALKPHGRLLIVMNHPAFRIPKHSSWGWDPSTPHQPSTSSGGTGQAGSGHELTQYRRIDEYLSESRTNIQMHPGENPTATTLSFHRPLQWYMKLLAKHGFAVTRLEEWISNKKSQKGPRAVAEDTARKEIPLFLFLEGKILEK
ncbi:class I SAM-dependent methyltransferase [Candidatus Uhrbacteria bacterium]|nr:class I SAM-dependent methyltransferase [Candidatus Uhrbacteria bacterium]